MKKTFIAVALIGILAACSNDDRIGQEPATPEAVTQEAPAMNDAQADVLIVPEDAHLIDSNTGETVDPDAAELRSDDAVPAQ